MHQDPIYDDFEYYLKLIEFIVFVVFVSEYSFGFVAQKTAVISTYSECLCHVFWTNVTFHIW